MVEAIVMLVVVVPEETLKIVTVRPNPLVKAHRFERMNEYPFLVKRIMVYVIMLPHRILSVTELIGSMKR